MEYRIPENAVILEIQPDYEERQGYNNLIGLCIKTDEGDVKILISDGQACCEDYGYLFLETPDDINKFIGARIVKIEDVCIGLSADTSGYGFDCGGETQLKVTTTKGVLHFAVYNSHNGYYGHATFVQVFNTVEKDCL